MSFVGSKILSDQEQIQRVIDIGLSEDVGTGDVSCLATVDHATQATGRFLAKSDGVLSGLKVAEMVFATVDKDLKVKWSAKDGDEVKFGTYFGEVAGPADSLLIAERLSLNLLQRMSGIATMTNRYMKVVKATGSKTRILDTRKTAPTMRIIDKLAVTHGGGTNHRVGLYDMVMVKDNHITAAGGIAKAVARIAKFFEAHPEKKVPVEVETRNLDEVREVIAVGGTDRVMLDNMVKVTRKPDGTVEKVDVSLLETALKLLREGAPNVETEASGNVLLDTVGEIAKTGVDFISSGQLTHSVTAFDISLKITLDA